MGAVAGRQGWQLGPEATRRAFADMRSVPTRGGRAGSCSWLAPSLSCPSSLGGWTGRGRRVGGWPVRLGRALVRGTQGSPGGRRWAAAAAAAAAAMGLGPRRRDAGAAALGALQGPGGLARGCAAEGVRLVAASRFLKFPILNPNFALIFRTLGPTWRAHVCKWPGWSMKGGGTEQAGKGAGRRAGRAAGCGAYGWRRALPCRPAPRTPPPRGLGWGGCPGTPGHLSRRGYRCAYHPIHTAPLLRSSLRSAGGSAASGASLPRSRQRLRPEAGEGGCRRGRGRRPRPRRLGFVGDWALPTTTAIASGGPRSAEAHAEAARSASSWGA